MKPSRLLLSLGVYTLLGFAPLAVNFLVLPVYTARLVPSEFGRLAVVNVAHSFLCLFIAVGVDTGYSRLYFDHHKDRAARGRLLATALTFLALSSALWAGLLFACGDAVFDRIFHDVELAPYRSALALGTAFQVFYSVAYTHFRNGERLRAVATLSLSTSLLASAAVVVAIYVIRADAPTAFAARNLAFSVAVLPFLAILVREAWPMRPALAPLRAMVAFGLPVLSYSLIAYLLFNGDRVVMERWFLAEELGLYALAVTIVSPLEILLQAGQQAIQPIAYRLLNAKAAGAQTFVSGVYSALLASCALASVAVTVLGSFVAELAKGSRYAACVKYLVVLCFAQLFRVVFAGYAFPVFYEKRTRALPVVSGLSVLAGLGVAYALRGWVGTMSVAYGVVGWKAAQALLMRIVVPLDLGPGKLSRFGESYALLASVGLWGVVQTVSPGGRSLGIGAGLVTLHALVVLARSAQTRWWRGAREDEPRSASETVPTVAAPAGSRDDPGPAPKATLA
jgi:O-antigen/teichoic acid export membrane protein